MDEARRNSEGDKCMKNVYFVQANTSYGNAFYLPYAPGCLAAYAWQFESIRQNYSLAGFFFRRDPIKEVIQCLNNPAIVAFSCYSWTFEYSKALAQEIKKLYPMCFIIFGGHSISENNDVFPSLPYVDVLIYGEGEHPFCSILEALSNNSDFYEIPNIAFRNDGKIIKTPRLDYPDLEGYLSPYIEGYFDEIMEQNPTSNFCAIVETNRGCPYQCAYCDWCYSKKMRHFPLEKIQKEIEWCSHNHIEYVFCADSNFGMFKRDLSIAHFVVEMRKQYGYPHIFTVCFAKNSNDTVFEIEKLFYENHLNKAAELAFQSLCDVALKNVNRQNFTLAAFSELIKKYNKNHIPTFTELILGLPGETYESFTQGICSLIEAGQQTSMTVYYCQVYSNALMGNSKYREKYGIQIARVPMNNLHSSLPSEDDIPEFTNMIIATNDMPFQDMIRSIMFCTCVQCFHHIGLLKFFAIYVRQELNVPYLEFYQTLLAYIFSNENTLLGRLFSSFQEQCRDFSNGEWSYYNEKFGKIGWFLEEGAFLEIVSEFDVFWKEILPFLKSFEIEPSVFKNLCRYQRFLIRLPGQDCVSAEFEFDFDTYFYRAISGDHVPLQKRRNVISVKFPVHVSTWEDYARFVVLFAKRRGDTIITNDRSNVNIVYLNEQKGDCT